MEPAGRSGGSIGRLAIGGELKTAGANVVTLEIAGEIGQIDVAGGVTASGSGSDAVHLGYREVPRLDALNINAATAERIVRTT